MWRRKCSWTLISIKFPWVGSYLDCIAWSEWWELDMEKLPHAHRRTFGVCALESIITRKQESRSISRGRVFRESFPVSSHRLFLYSIRFTDSKVLDGASMGRNSTTKRSPCRRTVLAFWWWPISEETQISPSSTSQRYGRRGVLT